MPQMQGNWCNSTTPEQFMKPNDSANIIKHFNSGGPVASGFQVSARMAQSAAGARPHHLHQHQAKLLSGAMTQRTTVIKKTHDSNVIRSPLSSPQPLTETGAQK